MHKLTATRHDPRHLETKMHVVDVAPTSHGTNLTNTGTTIALTDAEQICQDRDDKRHDKRATTLEKQWRLARILTLSYVLENGFVKVRM